MLLAYKPLHLEAQQRLQEDGCVVDIGKIRTYDLTTSNAIDAKLRLAGCASSTGIGVLTGVVGVRRGSTGPLGTGAALLTALVWELDGGDGAVSTGTV